MWAVFACVFILLSSSVSALRGIASIKTAQGRLHSTPTHSKTSLLANKKLNVGIVGATGAVGEEILSVMEKRNFPCSSLKLFASEKSSGKTVESAEYGTLTMEPFSFDVAKTLDVVLLAVSGEFALEWAEKLSQAGVLVSTLYNNYIASYLKTYNI